MIKTLKYYLLSCSVLLTACATTSGSYLADTSEAKQEINLRPNATGADIKEPLSLEDVQARTLAYNAEYLRSHTQLMDSVVKAGERGKELLPTIYASSFATLRNNRSASTGVQVEDASGPVPDTFFTAQDKAVAVSNFTTTWDLLEIGLSGLKKNKRNINTLTNVENNRLMCNKLIVDVESAYWRAVAYEEAERKNEWLKSRIAYALNVSQQAAEEKPESRIFELMFQREILDINRWYQALYRSLVPAKPDLARLMNLPAGERFTLKADRLPAALGPLTKKDPAELIETAYNYRPEIRTALYQTDKTILDNKEALWRHLPSMRLFLSGNHDTNSFTLNQDFLSAGLNLSWDILRLSQMNETKEQGEDRLKQQEHEIEVMASAVMAQVLIAKDQITKLDHDLSLAWKALSVQGKIVDKMRADFEKGDKPEAHLIKEELMKELYFMREQMARAELHTAKRRLEQSVGQVSLCQAPSEAPETVDIKIQDNQNSKTGRI